MLTSSTLDEVAEGLFGNPRTTLTANGNTMLKTLPGTTGVSRNPLRTLIPENGAERPANRSVTVVIPGMNANPSLFPMLVNELVPAIRNS